jgi:hypothetical protein
LPLSRERPTRCSLYLDLPAARRLQRLVSPPIKGLASSPNTIQSERHRTDSTRHEKGSTRERQPAVRDYTEYADRSDADSGRRDHRRRQ